jgi:hypothetical protein
MSTEFKHRMLRCIAASPRPLVFFTEGDVHATVAARHIEAYAAEMVADGLIFEREAKFYITEAGQAYLDRPTVTAPARYFLNACMPPGSYQPPKVYVRAGADQHKQYSSRGV